RHRLGWESTPIATLLSEELAANFSDELPESARVGPYLGFDENTVREDLLRALSRSGRSWILVEKLHPSSERSPADQRVAENVRLVTVRDIDLVSLLLLSDKVVGMTSVALFIASMLGVDCVSYQRGLVWKDLCAASRSGRVARLDRLESLEAWLRRPASRLETGLGIGEMGTATKSILALFADDE
ncbi:MAG TPA: hypothetical protein PKX74_20875, partial [Leptospiraceae bacterium]|nr:hypothetical protein [Leptospiraceae bacterium]